MTTDDQPAHVQTHRMQLVIDVTDDSLPDCAQFVLMRIMHAATDDVIRYVEDRLDAPRTHVDYNVHHMLIEGSAKFDDEPRLISMFTMRGDIDPEDVAKMYMLHFGRHMRGVHNKSDYVTLGKINVVYCGSKVNYG